jgi:TQXA domain-containing protein
MITMQRQRGRRRTAAVVAAVAAALGLVVGMASPALAAMAEVVGQARGESGNLRGSVDDGPTRSYGGGLFDITIDGEPGQAYCIDISTAIGGGATYDEADWDTSGVENLETVEAILRHYYPNGDGPTGYELQGSNAEKAMGTQAAIWHVTDGFELDTDDPGNSANVVANYETILAAVANGLDGFGEPEVTLAITPPSATIGEAGSLVGPYVIETTAGSVTVTPSDGVGLYDSAGEPFTGDIGDGTELWLSADGAAEGKITATAAGDVFAGRVFVANHSQTLVLAENVGVDAEATAKVEFTPPVTTTTSTESTTTTTESTTTTTESTTTTTVPPTTPSTAPPTTVPASGGGLPVTGAQSLVLAAVALLLVGLGLGFRYMSRRAGGTT